MQREEAAMLFTPITQILASRVQEQYYAGARLDGPTTVGKARRGFFSGSHGRTARPATRRTLAIA
jgi:hypothetical protein